MENYRGGKRNKFPRFHFKSDPMPLKSYSQDSVPVRVQEDFERLFDAVNRGRPDKADRTRIIKTKGVSDTAEEIVDSVTPTIDLLNAERRAAATVEKWLLTMLRAGPQRGPVAREAMVQRMHLLAWAYALPPVRGVDKVVKSYTSKATLTS